NGDGSTINGAIEKPDAAAFGRTGGAHARTANGQAAFGRVPVGRRRLHWRFSRAADDGEKEGESVCGRMGFAVPAAWRLQQDRQGCWFRQIRPGTLIDQNCKSGPTVSLASP